MVQDVKFGALVYEYQTMDVVGPFDLINTAGRGASEYLLTHNAISPETVEKAPNFLFYHIGQTLEPSFEFPQSYVDFIKRHHAAGKTIFCTCTGAAALASTGILDGKNATVNNVEYKWITNRYPKVNWSKDKKWVIDGNIWTGGGAVAGMDMFAHWLEKSFGKDVMMSGAKNLDYEPRDINGIGGVIPFRYDKEGKQVSTTVFPN
ncbi:uncharacterized protein N0V89_006409 [Didymosphaeria variabile]|uniref:DJ-1/PfpI domain-containing protein n=1 Tax=Didymosphaeria variabile TaxID=1932322 RepID=A0A9W8XMG3_9PLEO|nr:uncharacterized protein N0V89_006409 [Didymosphaeria variabile]KAJ4354672.1 hypothetical protein N0V89_006409 [Didymosphaeria variabile]